ncbi:MAG: 16S rRNA (cytidine(1402)-2'-O)-methyltransferase [Gemmatimonadales bacterium]|jgi:16S rRNA (cytidine1402-2'-O)-methyltransferase
MDNALFVVSTPIGNRADITERARQVLCGVDVVYAEDTRRTGRLLAWLGSGATLRSLHEHNEASRIPEILDILESGGSCALVSDAGTPVVSDPGLRLVRMVLEKDGRVVPVPGPSAVTAALAAAGLEGDRFAFLGFPPRRRPERAAWIQLLAGLPMTVVAFESPKRIGGLLGELAAAGLGERCCVICRELTKLHETIRRGTISELAPEFAEATRGEITLVLEAATEPGGWEDLAEELEREARRLGERGLSTRDIAAKLAEAFGVPRNVAYEYGLRFGRAEDRS